MPRFVDIQTNFSTGELDPLLRARVELEQYNNALAKATNVLIQPQGGLRRRPGTKHILELPNTSTASAEGPDSEESPQMPCPDVQPLDRRAPKPTNNPPISSRSGLMSVDSAVPVPCVNCQAMTPITKPRAHHRRQDRVPRKPAC